MNEIQVNGSKVIPSKIVCIGRNYVEHITELGNEIPENMVVFTKPNSAISDTLSSMHEEQLHYEGEICFIYSQGAFTAIGFGLDLTKRTLQSRLKDKGLPWERAKAFDGSAVFSEFISIEDMESNFEIELLINDALIQKGDVTLMMYPPSEILIELQSFMTLEDGDIVMTGTPKGVGKVNAKDSFTGNIKCQGKTLISSSWVAE